MLFNTLPFVFVFPWLFLFQWLLPSSWCKFRTLYLLSVSYVLYALFTPSFTIILLMVTFMTYIGGVLFDSHNGKKRNKRLLFLTLLLLSLLPLLVFKYTNFIEDNINSFFELLGVNIVIPGLNWAIPIGISFYTFQAVGYMLDVYWGRIPAEKNLLTYALFVSFFPQIVSGPISKAASLLPQLKEQKHFDYTKVVSGFRYLLWGMFLKVVIADRSGIYVDIVFNNFSSFSGAGCIIGSILYSLQIYTDFAGYSLMAVGVGKMLGYDLINNFRRPYFSISITDFWHRWHISLSTWLKDYIYIPLGGSRCSKFRNYWNIFVTFLVSGIWHGANWTFILWGAIHGLCQIIEKALGLNKICKICTTIRIFRIILTFFIVTIAWLIFRSPSVAIAFEMIKRFGSMEGQTIASFSTIIYLFMAMVPFVICELLQEFLPAWYTRFLSNTLCRWIVYLLLICMILQIGVIDGSSFIYASF